MLELELELEPLQLCTVLVQTTYKVLQSQKLLHHQPKAQFITASKLTHQFYSKCCYKTVYAPAMLKV